MTKSKYDPEQINKILHYIIDNNEGGYANNPKDPGKETKWGISKRSYPKVDIKNLTKDEALNIYNRDFVPHLPEGITDPNVIYHLLDMGINSGPGVIKKIYKPGMSAEDVQNNRMKYYQSLKGWNDFKDSWTNRAKRRYSSELSAGELMNYPTVERSQEIPKQQTVPTQTKNLTPMAETKAPVQREKLSSYRLSDLIRTTTGKELNEISSKEIESLGRQAGFTGTRLNKLVKGFEQSKGQDLIFNADGSTFQTETADKEIAGKSGKTTGNRKGFDAGDLIGLGRNVNMLGGLGKGLIDQYNSKKDAEFNAEQQRIQQNLANNPMYDTTGERRRGDPRPDDPYSWEAPGSSAPSSGKDYEDTLVTKSKLKEGIPEVELPKFGKETPVNIDEWITKRAIKDDYSPLGFILEGKNPTIENKLFGNSAQTDSLVKLHQQVAKKGIQEIAGQKNPGTADLEAYYQWLKKNNFMEIGQPGAGEWLMPTTGYSAAKALGGLGQIKKGMDVKKATDIFNSTNEAQKLLGPTTQRVEEIVNATKQYVPKLLQQGQKQLQTWGEYAKQSDIAKAINSVRKSLRGGLSQGGKILKYDGGGGFPMRKIRQGKYDLTPVTEAQLLKPGDIDFSGIEIPKEEVPYYEDFSTIDKGPREQIPPIGNNLRNASGSGSERTSGSPNGGKFDAAKLGVAADAVKYGLPFLGTAIGMKHLNKAAGNVKFSPAQLMRSPVMAMQKPNIARPYQAPSTGDVQYDALRQHATSAAVLGQEAAYNEANQNFINQQRMQDAQLVNQNNMFNAQGINQVNQFNAQKNFQVGAMKSQLAQEPWIAAQHMLARDRSEAAYLRSDNDAVTAANLIQFGTPEERARGIEMLRNKNRRKGGKI